MDRERPQELSPSDILLYFTVSQMRGPGALGPWRVQGRALVGSGAKPHGLAGVGARDFAKQSLPTEAF